MKRITVIVVALVILLSSVNSLAATINVVLEELTVEQLDNLIQTVEDEKKKVTEVSSEIRKTLENDFMKTVESLMPKGTKFSYPLFGLSVVHRRNYYCVCGTVGCRLPDKTKKDIWDATIIYWYDEASKKYKQAAFYSEDEVYAVDEYALNQVEANLEPIARENLKKHKIKISKNTPTKVPALIEPTKGSDISPTLRATATSKPTATLTPTPKTTQAPKPTASLTPKPVVFADVDLQKMTNEELESAVTAIKEEQRSRIQTKIVLDKTELVINIGKNEKVTASIIDVPEGEKTPKLEWITSDKKIVTCQNGALTAVAMGNAVITCQTTLSDGTYIYAECRVQVNTPVSSVSTDKQTVSMKGGEKFKPIFVFKPKNASITGLTFDSSNATVATVNKDGIIEGTGTGTAVITARTIDGSNKTVKITVKVVDNRISKDTAKKVALTAIGNDVALDIFTSDGNYYDKKKFHNYDYFFSRLSIINEGTWITKDGNNTWHVSKLLVQDKTYGGYFQYDFDIRFDGKNYYAENGRRVGAAKQKWLDKSDPSKYSEDDLSDLQFYSYMIIKPSQIGE